jgi:hypothetical protein
MSAMIHVRALAARGLAGPILLTALLAPAALRAQDVPDSAAAPQYEVELVVFRNLDQRGNTPEVARSGAVEAGETAPIAVEGAPASSQTSSPGSATWPELSPPSLRLAGIAARLRRPGAYQLLYHGGWVQAVERQNRAAPTPLPEAALQAGVSGALTLYRERYLHVLVDMSLGAAGVGDDGQGRIRQGRRLRGQAVQYFDHPQFGVIVAVRPVGDSVDAGAPDETADP